MNKALTLLALHLCACAPHPPCITKCGLQFQGTPIDGEELPGWECANIQRLEDQALDAYTRRVSPHDSRFLHGCGRLQAWRVFTMKTPSWYDDWGRHVSGLSACYNKTISVGSLPPFQGSLMHELAHAIQGCWTLKAPDESKDEDQDHAGWHEIGVYDAIDEVVK